MNSSRIAPDFFDGVSVTSDLSDGTFLEVRSCLLFVMTLADFIALCSGGLRIHDGKGKCERFAAGGLGYAYDSAKWWKGEQSCLTSFSSVRLRYFF